MSDNIHIKSLRKIKTLITCYYLKAFLSILFISCFSCSIFDSQTEAPYRIDERYFNLNFDKKSEYIIVIPDIQNYVTNQTNNRYLQRIIDWIFLFNEFEFKVKAVLQVGDITNFNSTEEWETARRIFKKLDNHVNYIFCTGNHDYGENGTCNLRDTEFSDYFDYKANTYYISSFERNKFENSYFQFSIQDQPFQVFSLEFGPRDKILAWADSIAKANMDRTGIILTHAYVNKDKERFNYEAYSTSQIDSPVSYGILHPEFGIGGVNDGEKIWNNLIYHNSNLKFVFSGHKTDPDYTGNLTSENEANTDVYQFLIDTQELKNGGDGIIQLFEFKDDNSTIEVRTLSTYSNESYHDSVSEFQINLDYDR